MPDYKKEVLNALGEALRDLGVYSPADYKQFARVVQRDKTLQVPLDAFLKFIISTTMGNTARIIFEAKPIRTQKERDAMVERIQGMHQRLRPHIAAMMNQLREAFPQKQRGPKSALTPQQKLAALSTIDSLRRNGSTLKHAIEIVARDYRVSVRLMRKYYEEKTPGLPKNQP